MPTKHRRVRHAHPNVSAEIHNACALLWQQHTKNAPDPITAIECRDFDVLIVSGYSWRNRLARFVRAAFSPEHPAVTQLKEIVEKLGMLVEEMETDMTPAKQQSMMTLLRPMLENLVRMMPPQSEETPPASVPPVQ